MGTIISKRFDAPDETRSFDKGRFEFVTIGGTSLGLATYEPGWRWSKHLASESEQSCQVEHVVFVLSGRAMVELDDGETLELTPGTVFHIPPGHDSWVLGDERFVSLHILGSAQYAT